MSIAYDNGGGYFHNATGTGTDSFTVSGSNRFLVVGVMVVSGDCTGVTATQGGSDVACTQVLTKKDPQVNAEVTFWYMVAPDSGTVTIKVSQTGAKTRFCYSSYTGVKQTSPVSGAQSDDNIASGQKNDPNLNVTTTDDGSMVIATCWSGSLASGSAQTGEILRDADPAGNVRTFDSDDEISPAGTENVGVNLTTTDNYAIFAIAVAPDSYSSGSTGYKNLVTLGTG